MALPTWALFMKKCYEDKTLKISKEDFIRPKELTINLDCGGKSEEEKNTNTGGDTDF
jgi:penicillin-binding protein 1A